MDPETRETVEKVRAAIKDRATWFALLYNAFKEALPEAEPPCLGLIPQIFKLASLSPPDLGCNDRVPPR